MFPWKVNSDNNDSRLEITNPVSSMWWTHCLRIFEGFIVIFSFGRATDERAA